MYVIRNGFPLISFGFGHFLTFLNQEFSEVRLMSSKRRKCVHNWMLIEIFGAKFINSDEIKRFAGSFTLHCDFSTDSGGMNRSCFWCTLKTRFAYTMDLFL